jgi:large subunit ribosomal protein L3
MPLEMVGRKLGMTQVFSESGDRVPVTIVRTGPCTVVQKKTAENDGYSAIQLGFEEVKEKRLTRARKGHFDKAGVPARRVLFEVRLPAEEVGALEVGQTIGCADAFAPGQKVDVTGTTKGRGFTGVVKRHGFPTRTSTHGTHEYFRHGGANGSGTFPGRVLPGMRMSGHYGDESCTILRLEVMKVDPERNLLFIRGAVPGAANGLVRVRGAIR